MVIAYEHFISITILTTIEVELKSVPFNNILVAETVNMADPIPAVKRKTTDKARNHRPF